MAEAIHGLAIGYAVLERLMDGGQIQEDATSRSVYGRV